MQLSKGMKIDVAKQYVADKLGVSVQEIHDPVIMRDVREDHKIGILQSLPGFPKGMEAKENISKLLGIELNGLRASKTRMGF